MFELLVQMYLRKKKILKSKFQNCIYTFSAPIYFEFILFYINENLFYFFFLFSNKESFINYSNLIVNFFLDTRLYFTHGTTSIQYLTYFHKDKGR